MASTEAHAGLKSSHSATISTLLATIPDTPNKPRSSYVTERGIRVMETLSKTEIRVYLAYLLHADEKGICWPLQDLIAASTHMSVRSVKRAVKTLKERRVMKRITVGRYRRWQLER